MSLNPGQRRQTADEFRTDLTASGLTREDIRLRSGLPEDRFDAAFTVSGAADPVDVWLVRDTLETAVVDNGGTPVQHVVLTEEARAAARGWFGVRDRR